MTIYIYIYYVYTLSNEQLQDIKKLQGLCTKIVGIATVCMENDKDKVALGRGLIRFLG